MTVSEQRKLEPEGDRDSAPYWDGIRRHQLLLQRCGGCGTLRWPAAPVCKRCLSFSANWEPVSGTGTVATWIVVQRAPKAAFADAVPYAVVLVALAEDPKLLLIGHVGRAHAAAVRRGLPVKALFRETEGGTELEWQPADKWGQSQGQSLTRL